MSAEPAVAAEIETTDAAPAADIAADTTGAVGTDVAAANDPSSEAYRSETAANEPSFEEAPKPLADNSREEDIYNDSGKGAQTGDQMAQKQIREQSVPAEWNIGGNGGGPLGKETVAEKQAKKSDDLDDFIDRIKGMHEEQQRQEEHARKWDNEIHEIGGQKFSGQQLHDSAQWFKKAEKRAAFEQQLVKQGATEEEAKRRADKIQEFDRVMEKVRTGTASEEEKARYETMKKDRQLAEDKSTVITMEKADIDYKVRRGAKENTREIQSEENVFLKPAVSDKGITAAGPGENIKSKIDLSATFNPEGLKPLMDTAAEHTKPKEPEAKVETQVASLKTSVKAPSVEAFI